MLSTLCGEEGSTVTGSDDSTLTALVVDEGIRESSSWSGTGWIWPSHTPLDLVQ